MLRDVSNHVLDHAPHVGIVGAVIAGLIFGVNMNAGITIESFLYALLGAIILLAIVNLIRRGTVR